MKLLLLGCRRKCVGEESRGTRESHFRGSEDTRSLNHDRNIDSGKLPPKNAALLKTIWNSRFYSPMT